MALSGKIETDKEIKASADKVYEFYKHKLQHVSNVSSEKVKGVELHEGEWGCENSIISWNYVHEGKNHVAKEIIEAIDDENKTITFKVIEGDVMEHCKSFNFKVQVIPKGQGSILHLTNEYEKLHDEIIDPHWLHEIALDFVNDLEAHLLKE